jgi:hypothetical protein
LTLFAGRLMIVEKQMSLVCRVSVYSSRRAFSLGELVMIINHPRPTEDQIAAVRHVRPVEDQAAVSRRERYQDGRGKAKTGTTTMNIETLVKLAKKFPPPQEWYDEDFDGL